MQPKILRALILLASILAVSATEAATCQIIIYYSDASMSASVGHWSNCPGMKGLVGRRTRFKEVSTEELRNPVPPPGTLPCEFLRDGCKPWGKRPG